MAVSVLAGLRIVGQSTDTKPTDLDNERWQFEERDTGRLYLWNGSKWIQDGFIKEVESTKTEGSPLIRLTGDEFATTADSVVFTLESDTPEVGSGQFSNPNGVTFTKDNDLPMRGFNVANFDGTNDYLSLDHADHDVGSGSFTASIWFKTNNKNQFMPFFAYGDEATSEQNWYMRFNSNGKLEILIDDGTNNILLQDPISNRWIDDKWHCAIMVVDRTSDIMYLYVDGMLLNSISISSVALTLDNTGESLYIGGSKNTSVNLYFNGQLANFHLIKSADYNAVRVLNEGIREAVNEGDVDERLSNSTTRLNNLWRPTHASGDYSTTVIDVEEGDYEIQEIYRKQTDSGKSELLIDGIAVRDELDTYNSSTTQNNLESTKGVKLSSGKHILKYRVTNKNASSTGYRTRFQFINIIKRNGHEKGGATSGLLLGDELDRETGTWTPDKNTGEIFNNIVDSDSDGNTKSGKIALKKGLYNFTFTYDRNTARGLMNLWVGGTKVFDSFDMSGNSTRNVQASRSAFIEGGLSEIKVEVKNNAGSTFIRFISLKFELVSGSGTGDEVTIWGADDDVETVSGVTPSVIGNATSARFNHYISNETDALNDEIIYRRYFSGGTYKVEWIGLKESPSGGETDILVDSTVIFNNIDQQGGATGATFNNKEFTTATISKGFHDIHIKNVLDGGTNDFRYFFQSLQFTKIAESPDAENDDNSDPVHGSLVPLGKYKAKKAESSHTFEFGDKLFDKYSEIKVNIVGETSASLAIQMKVNQSTSNYYSYGVRHTGGANTAITLSNNTTQYELISATILLSANRIFSGNATIQLPNTPTQRMSMLSTFHGVSSAAAERLQHTQTLSITELNTIEVKTSTSTWKAGTTIEIYGVRK